MRISIWMAALAIMVSGCAADDEDTGTTSPSTDAVETSGDAVSGEPDSSEEGGEESSGTEGSTEEDTSAETDVIETTDAVSGDANTEGDGSEVELACADFCDQLGTCVEWSVDRCLNECTVAREMGCGAECFDAPTNCMDAVTCLGLSPASRSFKEGPYGTNFRDIAGPVVIPTTRGEWSFETHFDGNDSYLFLNTTANSGDFSTFVSTLWASNFKFFIWEAPTNVHVFFMTFDSSQEEVLAMETKVMDAINKLDPEEACWWSKRVHFVTVPAQSIVGWIGELLSKNGWFGFAVDRQQQIRAVGLLQTVGGSPQLSFLAYEAQHYNFEAEREEILAAEDALVVDLVVDTNIQKEVIDVVLPGETELSQYNRLEIDNGNYCVDHLDSNCGEWDYMSYLFACEIPDVEENPYGEEACQPKVNEVVAVEEQMGLCPDEETPCSPEMPCPDDFSCLDYIAPVDPVEGVEADTQPCTCAGLMGEPVEAVHTCNGEGTGYGACNCKCDTEIARWITTYGREGRWVTDATPFLAYFKRGGKVRVRTDFGNAYVTDLSFRFTKEADSPVSSEVIPLFTGGAYNATYNDKYEPFELTVPEAAKRVEIVAFITGHGFGKDEENCAEFCNHEHVFTVNGSEYFHDHPVVGDNFGCTKQVPDGTVPNQYGTWYLGRGGWCPGMDVKPLRFDITEDVSNGETAILEYKSLFQGMPYVPVPFDWASGGFGALVRMTSYVVVYE